MNKIIFNKFGNFNDYNFGESAWIYYRKVGEILVEDSMMAIAGLVF